MSKIIKRVEVEMLGVFSMDNNTDAKIGEALGAGVNVRRLPWASHESLSMALDCWQSAEAAAGVLGGGEVGLAAKTEGVWFHINDSHILSWLA
jgi:hypothetical protein